MFVAMLPEWKSFFNLPAANKDYCLERQVCHKFGVFNPLVTYEMVHNTKLNKKLKVAIVNYFMDINRVDKTKF